VQQVPAKEYTVTSDCASDDLLALQEGDAFILAFHTAMDAASFAVAAQVCAAVESSMGSYFQPTDSQTALWGSFFTLLSPQR
jgi:hypothetical protein